MLGWAGLRGATPIWLATFPVVAGVGTGEQIFAIVFFVVVTSTLVQGASFEPLAKRLGLTTDEPALPRRLLESGRIRRMGGDVVSYRLGPAPPRPATWSANWVCRARPWSTSSSATATRSRRAARPRCARATSCTSSSAASCARRSRS